MNKTAEWMEIMALFRGRNLAVHASVAEGQAINTADLRAQEALGWLVYHRLLWHDGINYQARGTAEARALWAKDGPAKAEAAEVGRQTTEDRGQPKQQPRPETAGEPAAAPDRPRVHDHQPELFA